MYALDFILSMKVKSLLNIICDLNEKTNLLIWSLVFQVNYSKCKLKLFFNSVSNIVQGVFKYLSLCKTLTPSKIAKIR